MRWIGLTGGIASGKSTVAYLLRNRGFPVVDADEISRHLTGPGGSGLKSIVRYFGGEILDSSGELNRQKFGQLVFSDPKKLAVLENILHPLVQAEVLERRARFEKENHQFAFYDVPLLFEKNLEPQFDAILVVTSSLAAQKQRLKTRNQFSDSEIEQRIAAQQSLAEKEKKANFIIYNHGSLQDLEGHVDQFISDLKNKFQSGMA